MLHKCDIPVARFLWAVAGALGLASAVVVSCSGNDHPPLAACVPVALDAGADATLPDGAPAHVRDASISCVGPTGVVVGGPGAPGTGTSGSSGGVPTVGTIGNGGTDNGFGGVGATGGTTDFGVAGFGMSAGGFGTGAAGAGTGGVDLGLGGSTGFGIPGGTLPGFGGTGF